MISDNLTSRSEQFFHRFLPADSDMHLHIRDFYLRVNNTKFLSRLYNPKNEILGV